MRPLLLGLCVWSALGHAARAAEAGATGPQRQLDTHALTLQIGGDRIVLGETATVAVELHAATTGGAAIDSALPRLKVSTGTISPPVRTAPGTWHATFTPPKDAFPQTAILTASLDTSTRTSVAFASLRLWGKGFTSVKTKPGSQVTVFIGNESFGPITAAANGDARVPIVVPPGPERAVARSVDPLGNASQRTIDLGVPAFNRLAVVPLDDVVVGDGTGEARLLAIAVDKKGEPLFNAKISVRPSVGELAAPIEGIAPGLYRAIYRPGPAVRGEAVLIFGLDGAPGSTARVALRLLAGPPVRAEVELAQTTLTADEPRALMLGLRVFDKAGNSVSPDVANVDVDAGRIEQIERVDDTRSRVLWVIPALLTADHATLTARAKSGDVLGTRTVALRPGAPALLTVDPLEPVVADGAASVALRLHVRDAAGNPLIPTGAQLTVDAKWGSVVAATVDGTLYRARFVPTPHDRADFVPITATMGPLTLRTQVQILPRPRPRLLVGASVSASSNYAGLFGVGPDLSMLVRLPGFDGSVNAGLSIAVLQRVGGDALVDNRAFPVLVEAAWRPLLSPEFCAHLGAAGGFVLSDVVFQSGTRRVEPALATQAVAGIGYRVGSGFIELDARAGVAIPLVPSAVGAPLGAGVVLGYRFAI